MTLEGKLREVFGEVRKGPSGQYLACCPKCILRVGKVDSKFHLYINPTKFNPALKKTGTWLCHRCGWKGWGLDALGITSIEISSKVTELKELASNRFTSLLTESVKFPDYFSNSFSDSNLGKAALKYLLQRGVGMDQIVYHKIGFCFDGRYKNCVIVPVHMDGKLAYYVGRNIFQKKYMNPPMPNRAILFNYVHQDEIVLTEGVFDAMSVGTKGVALLGKFLKGGQKTLLQKGLPKRVYVMLDQDARQDAVRMAKDLKQIVPDVRLASTFNKKDPGSMTSSEIEYSLKNSYSLTIPDVLSYLDGTAKKDPAPTTED